jgi:hypothetical protein
MDKGSDPNQLTGDESREEGTLKPRDFFWDSSVLYLVSVIIALSLVDGFTEFIKGSSVVCNVDDNDNVSSDYINNFCAESLPITEYLPAFIFIHGLAIAIPHYLWMANFGGQFDYFFSVVSTMDRSRDDTTGQYSQKNFNIVRQLQLSFTTYGRNFVYYLYIGKLMLQMIFAVASLVVSVVYFTDFNVIFQCPRDNSTINNDPNWPLNNDVTCIFTSLKLLFWIRIGDIFLICLVVLALVWGFAWSFGGHPVELGATEVSQFSFQSGIQIEHYVAPFSRFIWCQKYLSFLSSFPWRFRSPGISTDLDFMLLKLYHTDAGLGQVIKEIQIDLMTNSEFDSDQEILTLHNNKYVDDIPLEIPEDEIDVQWTFDLNDGSPFRSFTPVDYSHMITVPNTVRGAVLGLGSFAPNNIGALYISFGQSGIALALSRVFQRVGSINFTKHKKEIDKEDLGTAADKLIDLQLFLTSHVSVTMPENILSLSLNYNINVLSSIAKIWEVIMRRGAKEIRKPKKTSYLVMGPMVTEEQGITGTLVSSSVQVTSCDVYSNSFPAAHPDKFRRKLFSGDAASCQNIWKKHKERIYRMGTSRKVK